MSFLLSPQRSSVAFDLTTGAEVRFEVEQATCILDIHSNRAINMADFGLDEFRTHGNFSKWVSLDENEGVAVTGLTSCGAVFLANRDCSRVAAGHMSGDARFVGGWCAKLADSSPKVEPYFILWGTGPDGSRKTGGKLLLDYMRWFGISPSRAPAVAACGALFLVRSRAGVACASHTIAIPFQRRGQAVREVIRQTEEEKVARALLTLESFNSREINDQFMLIYTLANWVHYQKGVPFKTDEPSMSELIAEHGKAVTQAYLAQLPVNQKGYFLQFEIFKLYPSWKR
jgi:hypothetical protein